jgi:hypothetical protein
MYSLFLIQQIKIETEVNTSTILSTLLGFGDIHCELIFLKKTICNYLIAVDVSRS